MSTGKRLQLKKVRFLKKWVWSFETLNSTFFRQNSINFSYKMPTLLQLLQFLRKKNYAHKISSRNSVLYKFHINFFSESFVSTIVCIIYLKLSTKVFSAVWISHWPGSSVKPSISFRGNFIWKCPLGPLYSWSLKFFIFHSNDNIWSQFLYFHTQILQLCNYFGTPILLPLSS